MQERRFVVTGASGFIGSKLCPSLLQLFPGSSVLALGRRHTAEPLIPYPTISYKSVDFISNFSAVVDLIQDFRPHAIIQLAGQSKYHVPPSEEQLTWDLNFHVPLKIAEIAKKIGALNVYASTELVFPGDEQETYSPTSPCAPLSLYGTSKLKAEEAMLGWSLIIRYSPLFGFNGSFFKIIYENFTKGKKMELFTDEYRCFMWDQDGVDMTIQLIEKALQDKLNLNVPWQIGGRECLSKFDLGNEITLQLGLDKTLVVASKSSEVIKDHKRPHYLKIDCSQTFKQTFEPRSFKEMVACALAESPTKVLQ